VFSFSPGGTYGISSYSDLVIPSYWTEGKQGISIHMTQYVIPATKIDDAYNISEFLLQILRIVCKEDMSPGNLHCGGVR
jgi:hypothetical protein